MKLHIITPDAKVLEGDVDAVTLPGTKGSFQVLRNHAPIISSLEKGEVKVRSSKGEDSIVKISGGVVEVLNNKVTVLAESTEE